MEFVKPGPNKRVCATLIDYCILSLAMNVLWLIVSFVMPGLVGAIFGSMFLSLIVNTALLLFRDAKDGQSPGKLILGLQVLTLSGQPAALVDSVKRNITTVIPIVQIIEYFIMRGDAEGRRWGDKFAQTRVTDLKPASNDNIYLLYSIGIFVVFYFVNGFISGMMASQIAAHLMGSM